MKLGVLNTTIATTDGLYEIKTISLQHAIDMVNNWELDSAIGHQSTADIMTTLLKKPIEMNRQQFVQQPHQYCLVFKLNGRPPEGKILTVEEIEEIGYTFKTMRRLK